MKSKYEFETVEIDGEIMAVPVGDNADELHSMIRLNETAAAILGLLREDTTEEAITDALMREYSGDRDEIAAYVGEFTRSLIGSGIVTE